MASILVIIIILALAVLAFFKVPMVQALATIVVALVSSFVAFGYYDVVGGLLAGFVEGLAPWAQMISFMLLFILVFAVLQTGVVTLLRGQISLGKLPERIGRPICGMVLGWIVAGALVTALWLAPLGNNLPYSRFDSRQPKLDAAKGLLFNADGAVAGWFGMVSSGSFKAIRKPASFGVVRAGFLDQMSLNRLVDKVARSTEEKALIAPPKHGVWEAPGTLVDTEGETIPTTAGRWMVVRLGIRKKALRDASPFTLAQVSIVCKDRASADQRVAGSGQAVCPIGFLVGPSKVQRQRLTEKIPVDSRRVQESQQWIDFVVSVPGDMVPVLGRFKLNNAVTLSAVTDEIPEPSDFGTNSQAGEEAESSQG